MGRHERLSAFTGFSMSAASMQLSISVEDAYAFNCWGRD